MKKYFICLLLGSLLTGGLPATVSGQVTDRIIFGGVNGLVGVGRYNGIDYGVGISGRYQYPLTPKVALTAKVGLDVYRVGYSYLMPTSYLGYGYKPITGFGFNTLYYNFYAYEYKVTGISMPVCFGPRVYLTPQVHADLNVGVDVAVNLNLVSVLHVEPGVGYTLRLSNGDFLDLNAGYYTSFARGSGVFTLGAAYGLKLNR